MEMSSFRCLPLAMATLAGLTQVHAADTTIGTDKNYRFVASATEPRPRQYQIFIKGEQSNSDRSCALFTAHLRTVDQRELVASPRESVASFLLSPNDFPVAVWLEDVRVESWATWYQKNQAQGRQGYGNPCLETQTVSATPPFPIGLPPNPNMPCDSVPTSDPFGSAAQHIAVANGKLRVEITKPDSNLNFDIALSDIDKLRPGSGSVPEVVFWMKAAQLQSYDNKGPPFVGPMPTPREMHLACNSQQDVTALMVLLRSGP